MSDATQHGKIPDACSTDTEAGTRQETLKHHVERVLNSLPRDQIAALSGQPRIVEVALRAALNAAATNADDASFTAPALHGRPAPPSLSGTTRALKTSGAEPVDLLSVTEFASRVGVRSKQTVRNWIRQQTVVGWPSAKNSFVLPEAQIDDAGCPVQGLDQVLPIFGDARLAWQWLTRALRSMDGNSPLALLRRGEIERVCRAARAFNEGGFG